MRARVAPLRWLVAGVLACMLSSCAHVARDCRDCPEMQRLPSHQAVAPAAGVAAGAASTARAPLWMGRHEITVGQFEAFVQATGRALPSRCFIFQSVKDDGTAVFGWVDGANFRNPGYAQTARHPAVCITWNDAEAYAEWLSQRTGRHYRLPTEAEIEYATRAGTLTRYFWGNDVKDSCRFANVADQSLHARYPSFSAVVSCDDGDAFTAPVGKHQPNPFGLYDTLGNAWEWTADCFVAPAAAAAPAAPGAPAASSVPAAPAATAVEPVPARCRQRVRRGGSWYRVGEDQRSALPVGDAHGNAGFRLVREP